MQLTVLIGLPATGKSTWAHERFPAESILSSDTYRADMLGDESDQSANVDVFDALYGDMEKKLGERDRHPCGIAFDATNLNAKRRKRAIELAHKYGASAHAVFFTEPLDVILQRNSGRDRRVPEDSIRQKYKTVHVPLVTEAWDSVEHVGGECYVPVDDLNVRQFVHDMGLHFPTRLADMDEFDQRNPHHTMDLMSHTMAVWRHLHKTGADWRVQLAGLYHDVGKLDTQAVDDQGIAHYIGHQYVSAQIAIQELRQTLNRYDMMYISTLIHLHMDAYNHRTLADAAKLARRLGNAELFNDVILLHEADQLAH